MANLQIKGIDDEFYNDIKRMAKAENRSVSQQVLTLLKEYVAKKGKISKISTPADVLLKLSGSWIDDRGADEIIGQIRAARKSSTKLQEGL